MKNFLQHCKGVCREAGIANGESAIVTTVGQVGQIARIVSYVRQAWIEIQIRHQHSGQNWRWMEASFTLTTSIGVDAYAYGAVNDTKTTSSITRFRNWMVKDYQNPPKIYLQSAGLAGQTWLNYIDWYDFKQLYQIGDQPDSFPVHITISPDNRIVLGPTPNDIYIVEGDYLKSAQVFLADDEVPDLPEDFEDAIMYRALAKHGLEKNASELVVAGEDGYATYLGALEGDQLAEIPIGGALA